MTLRLCNLLLICRLAESYRAAALDSINCCAAVAAAILPHNVKGQADSTLRGINAEALCADKCAVLRIIIAAYSGCAAIALLTAESVLQGRIRLIEVNAVGNCIYIDSNSSRIRTCDNNRPLSAHIKASTCACR